MLLSAQYSDCRLILRQIKKREPVTAGRHYTRARNHGFLRKSPEWSGLTNFLRIKV